MNILERIKKNSDLNAFLTLSSEIAYDKAKEVDKLVATGVSDNQYPLLGSALAHKDLFLTKGCQDNRCVKGFGVVCSSILCDRCTKV